MLTLYDTLALFQRPFDDSPDSDIPKNVPFTLEINSEPIPLVRVGASSDTVEAIFVFQFMKQIRPTQWTVPR